MSWGNPYVVERPLMEGDLFVGRHQQLVEVAHTLRRGPCIALVYGPTRIGRTSFLHQLSRELALDFAVVRVEMTWPKDGSVAQAIARLESAVPEQTPAEGEAAASTGAGSMPSGPKGRPVAVLVDGLAIQHLAGQRGNDWVVACQEWLSARPWARLVMAIEGCRPRAGDLASPALASLPSVELYPFTREETEQLLLTASQGNLTFEFDAIYHVWKQTFGHPYFVQLFGYTLFPLYAGRGRVSAHDVNRVLGLVVTAAQGVMERMWLGCSSQAQVVLVLASQLRGRHGVLTLDDLCGMAQQQGLGRSTVDAALAELLAKGIFEQLSGEGYRFAVDLFRRWVYQNEPLPKVVQSARRHRAILGPRRSPLRGLRWSTVVAWLGAAVFVSLVLVLWNQRGAAQRLIMGSPLTPTAPPFATRGTPVIGPALGQIAYMAKASPDDTWDIWTMRGDGSDPRRLTDHPANDMHPTWSPDGRYIAFVSDRDGNKEIYVMKRDGTEQLNLTHHPAEDWTPAWSPDGESIAFASYRDGNWEIYVMRADGSNPQRLTRSSGADYAPCWSPDSRLIAFQSNRDGNWEIYVMARDGSGVRRITNDEATDSSPAWSPDGEVIAFESYRDGNMEIYLMATDGSDQRNVSEDGYSNEHGPAWARQGAKLLYYSNRDGGWDIYAMKPDGTEKSNLTLSPALEQRPTWHE